MVWVQVSRLGKKDAPFIGSEGPDRTTSPKCQKFLRPSCVSALAAKVYSREIKRVA